MFNLLEMMEMLNGLNGEHGGSFSAGIAMEWYEEEEGRKPNFGVQVRCPIDRSLCAIDRTEDMP